MGEQVCFANTVFGNNVRRLRIRNNLTQAEMASMLGVQQAMISSLETGERRPSIDLAFAISRIFKVPLDELNNPSSTVIAHRLGVTDSELREMNRSNLTFPVMPNADYESSTDAA